MRFGRAGLLPGWASVPEIRLGRSLSHPFWDIAAPTPRTRRVPRPGRTSVVPSTCGTRVAHPGGQPRQGLSRAHSVAKPDDLRYFYNLVVAQCPHTDLVKRRFIDGQ